MTSNSIVVVKPSCLGLVILISHTLPRHRLDLSPCCSVLVRFRQNGKSVLTAHATTIISQLAVMTYLDYLRWNHVSLVYHSFSQLRGTSARGY